MMTLRTPDFLTLCTLAGLIVAAPAFGQDTAYAFSTKCFAPRTEGMPGPLTVQMSVRADAPRECFDTPGQGLSGKAFSVIYTKDAVDDQLASLRKEINDLTAKAIAAIKASVAENSVKAGDIDAAAKSIEDKLYENVLRRVKADLQASQPTRPAGVRQ